MCITVMYVRFSNREGQRFKSIKKKQSKSEFYYKYSIWKVHFHHKKMKSWMLLKQFMILHIRN